jgi:enoyl-CoA hydratase/carnithine racemase
MSDTILTQRDGPIATVVLNRPEKLNALTKHMWQRLGEVMSALSADDEIRCIVVRGAGEKAFAPGNDISEFENERANVEQARAYGGIMHHTLAAFEQCRHPSSR